MSVDEATPPETLTPDEWVNQARSRSVKVKRQLLIRYWVEANKFADAPTGIQTVGSNGGLYRSFNEAVKLMESKGLAPNTLAQFRGNYRDFIKSCVGHFDEVRYDAIVKKFDGYTVHEKLCPKPEEFRILLLKAGSRDKTPATIALRDQALLGMLGNTGMRIMESLSRKWSDIDFGQNPPRVRIEAKATKKRYLRYAFLSRETTDFLKKYREELARRGTQSEWVFPGNKPDRHADYFNVEHGIKRLFILAGLIPKNEEQSYSPHSFRAFAQMIMRRAGFSDTWADLIVGYKNVKTKSYKGDWDEIAKSWLERVEPHMNFLSPVEEMEKLKADQAKQMEKIHTEAKRAVDETERLGRSISEVKRALELWERGDKEAAARAIRAEKERFSEELSTKTVRTENHAHTYVKCLMTSPDFDEALAQGYEIILQDPKTGLYLMRKPKNGDFDQPREVGVSQT